MKKALMTATVAATIGQFNIKNLQILQELGYEVHVACDFADYSVWPVERIKRFQRQLEEMGIIYHQIDYSRSPLQLKRHLCAYRQLKRLILENKFQMLHCHTPIAAAISRIVAHQTKTRSIYTAHGFHFYTGAPLKNWLIFYPIERMLARRTDVLITINREDYQRAQKKFHAKETQYVPGVGVDLSVFADSVEMRKKSTLQNEAAQNEMIFEKRLELGITENDIMLLSVGELSKRKNHELVIRALAKMNRADIHYFICGTGELQSYLSHLATEQGIEKNVKLLGYRDDIKQLCAIADLYVFPSYQEGLPVALMEAIACKTPVICSRIRGNVDLVSEGLFKPDDVEELYEILKKHLTNRKDIHEKMSSSVEDNYAQLQQFSQAVVNKKMREIYEI